MKEEITSMLEAAKADVQKSIKEAGEASKAQLDALKNELEAIKADNVKKEEKDAIVKEIERIAMEIKAVKENPTMTEKPTIKAELNDNKETLKEIAKRTSSKEVVVKTLLQRSAITNNQQAYDLPDIGQLATRKVSLYEIFPKLNVGESNNNGVIRYYDWDEDTIARAAAAVAEGAAFPASTATFKKGSISLQKIGDTLPVTEEFFEDEEMFAAELGLFLETNVALEIDRQLADGDGTGNTIVGLKSSVNAYSLPATGTILDPSIYDLIVKLSEAITTTGGAKYTPDFAVMHISDINKMKLKKDANNNYVLPPFVDRAGNNVAGIQVFESNIITADTMVIGDRRFAKIYEKGGVVLSKGEVNTQFTEDEMTLKARKRIAFLIRAADKGGFLKVNSIDAALTALTII